MAAEGTQKKKGGEKKRAGFPRTPESQAEGITFPRGGVTWLRRRPWSADWHPLAGGAEICYSVSLSCTGSAGVSSEFHTSNTTKKQHRLLLTAFRRTLHDSWTWHTSFFFFFFLIFFWKRTDERELKLNLYTRSAELCQYSLCTCSRQLSVGYLHWMRAIGYQRQSWQQRRRPQKLEEERRKPLQSRMLWWGPLPPSRMWLICHAGRRRGPRKDRPLDAIASWSYIAVVVIILSPRQPPVFDMRECLGFLQ